MTSGSASRSEKLIEAGMTLSAELSLAAVLQRIVEIAADICGARYGALGVLSADGTRIDEFITTGMSGDEVAKMDHPPVGEGILGVLITDRVSLRLTDIQEDARASGFPAHHPPMHSFLGMPVMAKGSVFGNVYLAEKTDAGGFTAEDEEALRVLAIQAGVAVENARLYEEAVGARRDLERLAVMEDRERIARELHDGAIQSLFAVGMGLQGMAQEATDETARARVQQAVDEIDRVIRDLRNYIFGLRPGILADRQLDEAIHALAQDLQDRSGVVTIVDVDPDVAASLSSFAGEIVQLIREALSNVGRHADAATCRVTVHRRHDDEALAEVIIDDDGNGGATAENGAGQGLPNMRDRAARIGGDVQVVSIPGEGTTITVALPLR